MPENKCAMVENLLGSSGCLHLATAYFTQLDWFPPFDLVIIYPLLIDTVHRSIYFTNVLLTRAVVSCPNYPKPIFFLVIEQTLREILRIVFIQTM
jgi:hypothetical protein